MARIIEKMDMWTECALLLPFSHSVPGIQQRAERRSRRERRGPHRPLVLQLFQCLTETGMRQATTRHPPRYLIQKAFIIILQYRTVVLYLKKPTVLQISTIWGANDRCNRDVCIAACNSPIELGHWHWKHYWNGLARDSRGDCP